MTDYKAIRTVIIPLTFTSCFKGLGRQLPHLESKLKQVSQLIGDMSRPGRGQLALLQVKASECIGIMPAGRAEADLSPSVSWVLYSKFQR